MEAAVTEVKHLEGIISKIIEVLQKDDRILFAYLYGSAIDNKKPKDIDIGIYVRKNVKPSVHPVDIKVSLYEATGIPADFFDVRFLNDIIDHGDIFALLYLREVLTKSILLVDKDPDKRTTFLEHYGFKFRECESLIAEILK